MTSFGHGEAGNFIFMIVLVISAYDGVSTFIVGSFNFFIHDGDSKVLLRFFSDSIFVEYF